MPDGAGQVGTNAFLVHCAWQTAVDANPLRLHHEHKVLSELVGGESDSESLRQPSSAAPNEGKLNFSASKHHYHPCLGFHTKLPVDYKKIRIQHSSTQSTQIIDVRALIR